MFSSCKGDISFGFSFFTLSQELHSLITNFDTSAHAPETPKRVVMFGIIRCRTDTANVVSQGLKVVANVAGLAYG